jgi:hypothetical protein
VARNEGEVDKALAGAAQRVDAVYQMPFLAHAAMEPMNCTVGYAKDGCDIWVGTQAPTRTQSMVADLTGLPKTAIRIHNPTSPRCMNCHPATRQATQGDDLHPHVPLMYGGRFGVGMPGLPCRSCHGPSNVATLAESIASIPESGLGPRPGVDGVAGQVAARDLSADTGPRPKRRPEPCEAA